MRPPDFTCRIYMYNMMQYIHTASYCYMRKGIEPHTATPHPPSDSTDGAVFVYSSKHASKDNVTENHHRQINTPQQTGVEHIRVVE